MNDIFYKTNLLAGIQTQANWKQLQPGTATAKFFPSLMSAASNQHLFHLQAQKIHLKKLGVPRFEPEMAG